MKKYWLVLFFAFTTLTIHAQYRTYKNKYDVKDYRYQKTDRYNPTSAALLSVVPGLGHCSIGEPLRGFGFFGLTYGSVVLTVYGVSQAYQPGNKEMVGWLVGGGAALFVGSYIWSMADVTRVAKIKNMAFRDNCPTVHLYPSLQTCAFENTHGATVPGATLTFTF